MKKAEDSMIELRLKLIAQYLKTPSDKKKREIESKLVFQLKRMTGLESNKFKISANEGSWEIILATFIALGAWTIDQVGGWKLNNFLDDKFGNQLPKKKDYISYSSDVNVLTKHVNFSSLQELMTVCKDINADRLTYSIISESGSKAVEINQNNEEFSINLLEFDDRDDCISFINKKL